MILELKENISKRATSVIETTTLLYPYTDIERNEETIAMSPGASVVTFDFDGLKTNTFYKVTLRARKSKGSTMTGTVSCNSIAMKPVEDWTESDMTDTIIVEATSDHITFEIDKTGSIAYFFIYDIYVEEMHWTAVDFIQKDIEINKSIKNVEDPTKYKGDFSEKIDIILTDNTDQFMRFKSAFNNSFIHYKAHLMTSDGNTLLKGKLSIYELNDNILKVNIVSSSSGFFNLLKDVSLKDLEANLQYQVNRFANRNVWEYAKSMTQVIADDEYYSYVLSQNGQIQADKLSLSYKDNGNKIRSQRNIGTQARNDKLEKSLMVDIAGSDFYPVVSVYQVFKEIHAQQGYTCSGDFLETDTFKNLIINHQNDLKFDREEEEKDLDLDEKTIINEAEFDHAVKLTTNNDVTTKILIDGVDTEIYEEQTVEFLKTGQIDDTSPLFFLGEFDASYFSANGGCFYDIEIEGEIKYDILGDDYPGTWSPGPTAKALGYAVEGAFVFCREGDDPANINYPNSDEAIDSGIGVIVNTPTNHSLDAPLAWNVRLEYGKNFSTGEQRDLANSVFMTSFGSTSNGQIKDRWMADPNVASTARYRLYVRYQIFEDGITDSYGVYDVGYLTFKGKIKLIKKDNVGTGENIPFNKTVPDIKQSDFLNNLAQMFNLRFEVNEDTKNVEWFTYDEFYSKEIIEFNNVDKDNIKHILGNTFQANQNIFKYLNEDEENTSYKFGSKNVRMAGMNNESIDFVSTELILNDIEYISAYGFPISKNNNVIIEQPAEHGIPVNIKEDPSIGYMNEITIDANGTGKPHYQYMRNHHYIMTPTTIQSYYVVTPILNLEPTASTNDIFTLEFNTTLLFDNYKMPTNTIFEFHEKEMLGVLNKEAEILEVKTFLEPNILNKLSLRNKIVFDNNYFIIDSIQGMNENNITKFKLLRINYNPQY